MKTIKHLLIATITMILLLSSSIMFAQTATWALTADPSVAVTGNITATAQTVTGITVASYTAYNGPLGVPSQRSRVTAGWPQNLTYNPALYYEYTVTPTAGNSFYIGTVSTPIGAVSTNNLRASIFYSTDNFATSTSLVEGLVLTQSAYLSPTPTFYPNITITAGTTFSLRVFPYYTASDASTSRYVVMQNVIISSAAAPMPLHLQSFNAAYSKNKVSLEWQTLNEVNTQKFEIEKCNNATDFVSIGAVSAKNNGLQTDYSYTDAAPFSGITYYRLKMIDKDGAFAYSKTVSINSKVAASEIKVFPNPIKNNLIVTHDAAEAEAALHIVSLEGKLIGIYKVQQNAVQTSIDVSGMKPGSYMLIYINGRNKVASQQIIKE